MPKLKLLIAEDDKVTRRIYQKGLPETIFETRMVADGSETLKTYKEWNPDVILLDIMMPVLNGFQVLQKIRTNFKDKATTIIMATSMSEKSSIVECVKLGIQGYVIKPFPREEIASTIVKYHRANPNKKNKEQVVN